MSPPKRPARSTGFDSSPLLRCLASLNGSDAGTAAPSAPERLAQWLAWTDAIALSAALADPPKPRPTGRAPAAAAHQAAAAAQQARRVADELAESLRADPSFSDEPADAASCRAGYRLQQRTMALRIDAVRGQLRSALAALSPQGAQLAALDAVLAGALAARERQLFGSVPELLDRHFRQALPADAGLAGQAATEQGSAWRRALQAELATRWQPVDALVESLGTLAEAAS